MSLTAPDGAEAITAWRIWRLAFPEASTEAADFAKQHPGAIDLPRLISLNGTAWNPGMALEARCAHQPRFPVADRVHDPDRVPNEWCNCGIYAVRTAAELAIPSSRDGERLIVGEVAPWGRVVVHERGYRAAFAYPRRLYYLEDLEGPLSPAAETGLRLYSVPVARHYGPPQRHAIYRAPRPAAQSQSAPGAAVKPIVAVSAATLVCDVCKTPTATPRSECTNANHAWASHQKWKMEMKAAGRWTFMNWLDDVIDPPPRRGQTREEAEDSLFNKFVRNTAMVLGFIVMFVAAALLGGVSPPGQP